MARKPRVTYLVFRPRGWKYDRVRREMTVTYWDFYQEMEPKRYVHAKRIFSPQNVRYRKIIHKEG